MASNFKFIKYFYFPAYCLFSTSLIFLEVKPVKATEDICQLITKSENIDKLIELEQTTDIEQSLNEVSCERGDLLEVALRKSPFFASYIPIPNIRQERYDNIIWLLNNGFDLNQTDRRGDKPFHLVTDKNDLNLIYLLVENGANINVQNKLSETPLHLRDVHPEVFNLLLHLGANPEIRDYFGNTVLQDAVDHCSVEQVELLLQHGAKLSNTLLEYKILLTKNGGCVDDKKELVIIALIEKYQKLRNQEILKGTDPNQLTFDPPPPPKKQLLPSKQDSPIITATRRNDLATVKQLIAAEENIDAVSKSGEENSDYAARSLTDRYSATALHIALSMKHKEIAKLLIESGADITLQNAAGHHPLYLATFSYELTKLLLDRGAVVEQQASSLCELTALMSNTVTVEVADQLLQNGADPNFDARCGYTPLYAAIKNNNFSLIKFLINQGANVNPNTIYLNNPLYQATKNNQPKIIDLLIKTGAFAELNRAYEVALLEEYQEIALILKQAGASYFDSKQLLKKAVYEKKVSLVIKLLDEGLDSYLKTEEGASLLFSASL